MIGNVHHCGFGLVFSLSKGEELPLWYNELIKDVLLFVINSFNKTCE